LFDVGVVTGRSHIQTPCPKQPTAGTVQQDHAHPAWRQESNTCETPAIQYGGVDNPSATDINAAELAINISSIWGLRADWDRPSSPLEPRPLGQPLDALQQSPAARGEGDARSVTSGSTLVAQVLRKDANSRLQRQGGLCPFAFRARPGCAR